MAVAGLTTPSMAEAMSGNSKRNASISQEMSTSSGSRVRRLGTIAMSSNPYARRPDLPMPISTSATPCPLTRAARKRVSLAVRPPRPAYHARLSWGRRGRRSEGGDETNHDADHETAAGRMATTIDPRENVPSGKIRAVSAMRQKNPAIAPMTGWPRVFIPGSRIDDQAAEERASTSPEQVSAERPHRARERVRCLPRHEVAAVAEEKRPDVVREDGRGHAVVVRVQDVVARAEHDQGLDVGVDRHHRQLAPRRLGEHALVAAEAGAELGPVGERLGVEVDIGAPAEAARGDRRVRRGEAARMSPESGRVEGGDVAAPFLGGFQFAGEAVGVRALAHEVVARFTRGSRAQPGHAL